MNKIDYKEKYENALERARVWKEKSGMPVDRQGILDDIFPELKESEDEKIRKGLIDFLKSPFVSENITDEKITPWIDWLEKQGEQKSKFRVGDAIKCKHDDRIFTIKSIDLDKGTYTYTQEGCGNDIDYADEMFELVEQKPAWSEEDEKERKRVVGLLEGWLYTFNETCYAEDCKCGIAWLKSLKERMEV